MANVITWRNINAPSFAGVQQGMASAREGISDGIAGLQGALQTVRTNNDNSFDEARDMKTQSLMDQIQGLGNLDGYGDLSTDVRSQLDGMGSGQVDKSKILASLGQRDDTLRTDATNEYNYSEAQRKQREDPIIAAARSRIQNGTATIDGLSGLDIQDTSGLTKSFNDKLRSDKDYAYGQDQIRQSEVGAQGAISLGQTAQTEGDLTRIQNKYIKDNNLKGRHATEFKAATDATYKRANTLTTEANNEITDRASQYTSSVSSLSRQRDFVKQQTIPAVLPEEVESYSSDYAKSDAVKYIGELSGETPTFQINTPTALLNSGVEGKENGITYAEKGIKEIEEKLLADIAKSLPTEDGKVTSTSQLHENFKRDGIPGIVVKRAFDRTAREGSEESKGGEWEYEQFTNLLKEEFKAYASYKDKIFKSQQFDKETENQLSTLTKQNADNLRKFEKQHRGFQKFTNQPK